MTALHALLRFLTGLTKGEQYAAEDLLQETMLRAWRNLDTLPTEHENTRRWLFKVARRIAIDAVRRRQARPTEINLLDLTRMPDRDDTTNEVLALHSMREAMHALTEGQRHVLFELYFNGLTSDETAKRLGVPVGTVKSRAHYALQQLRTAVSPGS